MIRCVLHIGTTKTGSSSIQRSCFAQRAQLAESGIAYFDWRENHSYLHAAFHANVEEYRLLRIMGYATPAVRRAFADDALAWLETFLAKPEPAVKVISGEGIADFAPGEVAALQACLARHCAEIDVIVYVRDPLGYANSQAQQHVRGGMTFAQIRTDTLAPAPGSPAAASLRPNYRRRIEKFQAAFGADRVLIRPFRRDRLAGGDVVEDFLHTAFGRDAASLGIRAMRVNEALDHTAVLCLEAINRTAPPLIDGALNPERARTLVSALRQTTTDSPFRMPDFDWPRFVDAVASDVAWLAETTGGAIDFSQITALAEDPAAIDLTTLAGLLNTRLRALEKARPEARTLAYLVRLLLGREQAVSHLNEVIPHLSDPTLMLPLARLFIETGYPELARQVLAQSEALVDPESPERMRLNRLAARLDQSRT